MLKQEQSADVKFDASVRANVGQNAVMALQNRYRIECFDKDGKLKWVEDVHNLVTNQGLNDVLDVYLHNGTQTATWYLGLTDDSPTINAADTLASHAGWVEVSAYTGNRQAVVWDAVSAQSVDNSGNVNAFAITGTAAIGGAFLASVATGTAGILYSVAAFSANRSLENGDTLNVTVTCTAANP